MENALGVLVMLLSLFVVIYPRLEAMRDKRFKSKNFLKSIPKQGKILLFAGVILFLLQGYLFFEAKNKTNEIEGLKEKILEANNLAKLNFEETKPRFNIRKNSISWVVEEETTKGITICIDNNGCRTGSAISGKTEFFTFDKDYQFRNNARVDNLEGRLIGLLNRKLIDDLGCCIIIRTKGYKKSDFSKSNTLLLQIQLEYIDDITKKEYSLVEHFYYDGKGDKMKIGLTERMKNFFQRGTKEKIDFSKFTI